MENERLSGLYKKERISKIFGVASFVGGIIALILSKGYSTEASGEIEAMRASNPEYQAMIRAREEQNRIEREKERENKQQRYLADSATKEKELEAEKQRYILEQEKLKVDQENKRLSSIQARASRNRSNTEDLPRSPRLRTTRLLPTRTKSSMRSSTRLRGCNGRQRYLDCSARTAD